MFRHYRAILRELVNNTLPSYTSISNAAVGNTIYNYDIDLHILLIQMSAFVFSNFSMAFFKLLQIFASWASIILLPKAAFEILV